MFCKYVTGTAYVVGSQRMKLPGAAASAAVANAFSPCAVANTAAADFAAAVVLRLYSCTPQRLGVVPSSWTGEVRFYAWNQPPASPAAAAGEAPAAGGGAVTAEADVDTAAAAAAETEAGAAAAATSATAATTTSLSPVGGAAAAAGAPTLLDGDSGVLCVYLPVPYTLPPVSYASSTTADRPWCLDEHFPGRDRFGDPCPNLSRR